MANSEVFIQPTPNPNALKFICKTPVKGVGSSTYRTPMECGENEIAVNLFTVRGVDQIHLFSNVVTITKFNYESWDEIEPKIIETIDLYLPKHNPGYEDYDPEEDRRKALSPELQKIETIFDRTIRPGLQADGGDVQAISYEDGILLIKYAGACGTCPSSTTGTLEAMKGILRDEFNPDIDIYIAPDW